MLSASARVPSFSSNIHRERLRQSPGFLSAVRVVDRSWKRWCCRSYSRL